jgi:hypothetical protein
MKGVTSRLKRWQEHHRHRWLLTAATVVAIAIGAGSGALLRTLYLSGDSQLAAAAFGALVAFVLIRVAEWLTAWYKHRLRNHACLLGLEVAYRQYRIEVSRIRCELSDAREKRNILSTLVLELSPLPEPTLPATDLDSLDLLNRLASHWACARKLNASLLSVQKGQILLEATTIGSSQPVIDPAAFHGALHKALGHLEPFAKELDEKTTELIACVGVLLQESAPPFLWLYEKIHPRWVPDNCRDSFQRKLKAELERVKAEFVQCDSERAREIENRRKEE